MTDQNARWIIPMVLAAVAAAGCTPAIRPPSDPARSFIYGSIKGPGKTGSMQLQKNAAEYDYRNPRPEGRLLPGGVFYLEDVTEGLWKVGVYRIGGKMYRTEPSGGYVLVPAGSVFFLGSLQVTEAEQAAGEMLLGHDRAFVVGFNEPGPRQVLEAVLADPRLKGTAWEGMLRAELARMGNPATP